MSDDTVVDISQYLLDNGPTLMTTSVRTINESDTPKTLYKICKLYRQVDAVLDISLLCDCDGQPIRRKKTASTALLVSMPYMYMDSHHARLEVRTITDPHDSEESKTIIAVKASSIHVDIGREMLRVFKVNSCIVVMRGHLLVATTQGVSKSNVYDCISGLLTQSQKMQEMTRDYTNMIESTVMKMITTDLVTTPYHHTTTHILDMIHSTNTLSLDHVANTLEMVRQINTFIHHDTHAFMKRIGSTVYQCYGFNSVRAAALASDIFEYETGTCTGLTNFNMRVGLLGSTSRRENVLIMIQHDKLLHVINQVKTALKAYQLLIS